MLLSTDIFFIDKLIHNTVQYNIYSPLNYSERVVVVGVFGPEVQTEEKNPWLKY